MFYSVKQQTLMSSEMLTLHALMKDIKIYVNPITLNLRDTLYSLYNAIGNQGWAFAG